MQDVRADELPAAVRVFNVAVIGRDQCGTDRVLDDAEQLDIPIGA